MAPSLADRLAERARAEGSLGFDEVMAAALYDPSEGFYGAGAGAAGRGDGDFLTSPEVGPLFGEVLARRLAERWDDLGRPRPFTVVEAAAGRGALARSVVAASPPFLEALDWVLVERSSALRAAQRAALDVGGGAPFRQAAGLSEVTGAVRGVVLANELLDNLPVRLARRSGDGWDELRVVPHGGGLVLGGSGPLTELDQRRLASLAPAAPEGAVVPLADAARRWVRAAVGLLSEGEVLLFDYGDTTAALAERPLAEWLRTYRRHDRAGDPLDAPGTKDVTCEVPVDQFDDPPPDQVTTQADLLRDHGIDELVEEGRRVWHERAHLGDLVALRARSRVREAEALTDPEGLGAFRVLVWRVRTAS